MNAASSSRYASVLRHSTPDPESIDRIRGVLASTGRDRETVMGNLLVHAYGRVGLVDRAMAAFDAICEKNRFSWTILMSVYIQCDRHEEALVVFRAMDLEGVAGDGITLLNVVSACAALGDISRGKKIHARIFSSGYGDSVVLSNSLVHMYGKCGSVEDAKDTFDGMRERDLVSWNAMITVYAQHECGKQAIQLYACLSLEGIKPDVVTFTSLVNACSGAVSLHSGASKMLLDHVLASGFTTDLVLVNSLISLYSDCGHLGYAEAVFDGSPCPDVCSWTTMIGAYTRHGKLQSSLHIWRKMQQGGFQPNEITCLTVLDACSSLGDLQTGKYIHSQVVSYGLESFTRIGNSLISMYGKCRSLLDARDVFDAMLTKNVITWTAMVVGHAQCEDLVGAIYLCREMMLQGVQPQALTFAGVLDACRGLDAHAVGVSVQLYARLGGLEFNATVCNALVIMYCKCGVLEEAERLFWKQQQRMKPSSWASLIAAYAERGLRREALELFHRLDLEGLEADETVFASVLGVLSTCDSATQVSNVHSRVVSSGLEQEIVAANSLITAYGREGNPDRARDVFTRIPTPNVISWTALITACGHHGDASVKLFELMNLEGVKPNASTFASVLCACGSIGDYEAGKRIHSLVQASPHADNTTVLNAAVSLYAKCSRVAEASQVFSSIPNKDAVSWNVIISTFGKQGHFEEAIFLSRQMQLEGFVSEDVTFTIVLYSCSQTGQVEAASQCFWSIVNDFGVLPGREHYVCLIDVLGRAGRTADAEELKDSMPFQADSVALESLLSACKIQEDREVTSRVMFDITGY